MADIQPMAPTDAEIAALAAKLGAGFECDTLLVNGKDAHDYLLVFARATLAKWGAQPVVPAGYALVPVEPTDAMVQAAHHLDLSYMPGHEGADRAAIYRAMLAAAPQPVVREPLTPERVKAMVLENGYGYTYTPDSERAAFVDGIRHGEAAHGIT